MSISIITPVYNGATAIRPTLDSLSRQTVPFEHIVMDAASKDGTPDVVREYQGQYNVSVISEPDEGHYDAVQKGFAKAKGDILGWINAGDFYLPWTLRTVERVFEKYPEVEWITGIPAINYSAQGLIALWVVAPVYSQTLIRRGWHNGRDLPHVQQESTFWRRSLWDRAGGATLLKGQGRGKGYATDFHLWRRFAEHAPLKTVSCQLAAFSIMPGQITERLRDRYFQECGVDRGYDHSLRFTTYLWIAYSFLRIPATIKAHHLMK